MLSDKNSSLGKKHEVATYIRKLETELLAFLEEKHGRRYVSRLKHCFGQHFDSLELKNRSVLEIGAGRGYMSALCLARGASRVVALEPESDGCRCGPGWRTTISLITTPRSVETGNAEDLAGMMREF